MLLRQLAPHDVEPFPPMAGLFAIVGLSIRNGISPPSTVALSFVSAFATRSSCSRLELAEMALAREPPELADASIVRG